MDLDILLHVQNLTNRLLKYIKYLYHGGLILLLVSSPQIMQMNALHRLNFMNYVSPQITARVEHDGPNDFL